MTEEWTLYMSLKVRATFLLVVFSPSTAPSPPLSPLGKRILEVLMMENDINPSEIPREIKTNI